MSFDYLDSVPVDIGVSAIQLAIRYLLHKSGQKFMEFGTGASPKVKELYWQILTDIEPHSKEGLVSMPKDTADRFIAILTKKAIQLVSARKAVDPKFGELLLEKMRQSSNVGD